MNKLTFNLDLDVTLFTGEGNFKVDKNGNPWDITYLVHGDVKRYENASVNRLCSIKIEKYLKYLKGFEKYIKNYHIVNRVKKHVWQSAFKEYVPYKDFYAYKSDVAYKNFTIYHEMNPVGVPNPPRWLIKEQASWVSAGVWGHRFKNNSPVESCSELVCISVGDYLVNSVNDEVETFVFSGPVEEIARVADFLDYMGTPSFRFLADPIVLVPSGSSESVFEQEAHKMSEMMDWVSAGEYWMGGAVMRHKEDSCECPSCSPELLPDLLVS